MIRVAIVFASALMRAGLEAMLDDERIEVVGSTESLHEAADLGADVIVVDWDQDEPRELLALAADSTPILVLASDSHPSWLGEALRAGIRGVLSRDASSVEITTAIEAVAAGLVVIHPAGIEGAITRATPLARADTLSPREIEVLKLIAEGLSNKAIAFKLDISEHTVKFHVNAILSKLNAGSRTEAVLLGLRSGLVPL